MQKVEKYKTVVWVFFDTSNIQLEFSTTDYAYAKHIGVSACTVCLSAENVQWCQMKVFIDEFKPQQLLTQDFLKQTE